MLLENRIKFFSVVGKKIEQLTESELKRLAIEAHNTNNWFTETNVRESLHGISKYLRVANLRKWLSAYNPSYFEPKNPFQVGVVVAGNIPLVGFHDLLCVLISGHQLMLKMSAKDEVLMRYLLDILFEMAPEFGENVKIVDKLNDADAYIATGRDNTARYFKYYFRDKPHIIRQNRTSVVVLTGKESADDIHKLGRDIFQYFGLGCRNISKAFVPQGYDFKFLLDHLQAWEQVGDHHKYRNNYDYNKSIYLVNKEPHLDNGFLLVRESEALVSPVAVLFYQHYTNEDHLDQILKANESKIQCTVGTGADTIPFGQAQYPELWDYADDVDTMAFLSGLDSI